MIGALGKCQRESLGYVTSTRRDQATTEMPGIKGRSADVLGKQGVVLQELASDLDLEWRRTQFRQIEEEKEMQGKGMTGQRSQTTQGEFQQSEEDGACSWFR